MAEIKQHFLFYNSRKRRVIGSDFFLSVFYITILFLFLYFTPSPNAIKKFCKITKKKSNNFFPFHYKFFLKRLLFILFFVNFLNISKKVFFGAMTKFLNGIKGRCDLNRSHKYETIRINKIIITKHKIENYKN